MPDRKEAADGCPHIKGKTADDCPECSYLAENPMLPESGYCKYPVRQRDTGTET